LGWAIAMRKTHAERFVEKIDSGLGLVARRTCPTAFAGVA